VLRDDEDPVIGMALEKVKKCPNVVALAGGSDSGYQRRAFRRLYRCFNHRLSYRQAAYRRVISALKHFPTAFTLSFRRKGFAKFLYFNRI
jgi:hypothetical protein